MENGQCRPNTPTSNGLRRQQTFLSPGPLVVLSLTRDVQEQYFSSFYFILSFPAPSIVLYRVCLYTLSTLILQYIRCIMIHYPIGSRSKVGPASAEPIKPHGENVMNLCKYAYAVLPLYSFLTCYYSCCSLLQSIYTRHYSHLLMNIIKQMKRDINRWNKPVPTLIHRGGVSKRVTDGVAAT